MLRTAASIHPALQQALSLAGQCLDRQDFAGAERAMAPLALFGLSTHPDAMNMLGAIRLSQGRCADAAALLAQCRLVSPRDPVLACNLGRALMAYRGFDAKGFHLVAGNEQADAFSFRILMECFVHAKYAIPITCHIYTKAIVLKV